MTTRIIALFNLKAGVSSADYERWALTTDIPTVRELKSIAGFEVLRSTGVLGSDQAPPFRYIEIIDVADMMRFGEDVATATMQKIAAEFQAMTDDLVFIQTEKLG